MEERINLHVEAAKWMSMVKDNREFGNDDHEIALVASNEDHMKLFIKVAEESLALAKQGQAKAEDLQDVCSLVVTAMANGNDSIAQGCIRYPDVASMFLYVFAAGYGLACQDQSKSNELNRLFKLQGGNENDPETK